MATTPNDLPQPETVEDFYLAAILDELKAIHVLLDRLGKTSSSSEVAAGHQVELREPAAYNEFFPVRKKGRAK
jgi:hypothetical protein